LSHDNIAGNDSLSVFTRKDEPMDVREAILKRRAYRALGPVDITDDMVKELADAARLSASCFNNQPWRFVFVRSASALAKVHEALNKNNGWACKAPLIIAAFAKKENDCLIKEREFYLFDLGMAVSALLLRATELGLVAHPIAGFDPDKIRQALNIPEGNMVLTVVIVGKKTDDLSSLTPGQASAEAARPPRLAPENIYGIDSYNEKMSVKVEH
jgi:nitroreductase